jgi:predicted nucleic acid-binding protein
VNASTLIYLTHVGLLEVLNEPGVPVLVPDRVVAEIGAHGPTDPAVIAVGAATWIQVAPDPVIPQQVEDWGLDAGESAVLALAWEQPGSQAILHDLAARHCPASLGISTQGTLGLMLVAKQPGFIPAVGPLIDTLRRAGFYVSDRLAEQIRRTAGE